MKVYIRKIMKHDMTHEVSITQYVYYDFFGGRDFVTFQVKGVGHMYTVTFNDATDLRFGADFKSMCRIMDVKEGDFLIIKRIGDNNFSIDVDRKNIAHGKKYAPFFTGLRRHLIASIKDSSIIKEYVR